MESPIHMGDSTTNSINNRLTNTHLNTTWSSQVNSVIYSGEKCIQLTVTLKDFNPVKRVIVLRRVQDSYINVNQLLEILVVLNHLSPDQVSKFVTNEIVNNLQFHTPEGYTAEINDLSNHKNKFLKGIWISFDRAVNLATKFDIYQFSKQIFLIDVHDYDELPKLVDNNLPIYDDDSIDKIGDDGKKSPSDVDKNQADDKSKGSPIKKRKLELEDDREGKKLKDSDGDADSDSDSKRLTYKKYKQIMATNSNYPFTLFPMQIKDQPVDAINDVKSKFGQIFKKNETMDLTTKDIKAIFKDLISSHEQVTDIPLDNDGKTALHFAATLGSVNLVSSFVSLQLNSPIRGSNSGESPLISAMLVTNSMETGNFLELLENWLYPNIFLINNNNWSFLHYLTNQSLKKIESGKFYLTKILHFIMKADNHQVYLYKLLKEIINLQDTTAGNTCLHLAAEQENKWFIDILIELQADLQLGNKIGIKPIDYDIVKEVVNCKKLGIKNDYLSHDDYYLLELIKTNVEFLQEKLEVNNEILEDEEITNVTKTKGADEGVYDDLLTPTNKLFNSINDLLKNTNREYEIIMNNKKQQINDLNKQLYDTTLITANNKFLHKKINEKFYDLDNLKLQMSNITEKLELLKQELPKDEKDDMNDLSQEDSDMNQDTFDADEPFRIDAIYKKLVNKESVTPEELMKDESIVKSLPDSLILKARINSYKQLNSNIESELKHLSDYNGLTAKFKKVVSFCTGVDINEVDELLDGLLEAVESQQ